MYLADRASYRPPVYRRAQLPPGDHAVSPRGCYPPWHVPDYAWDLLGWYYRIQRWGAPALGIVLTDCQWTLHALDFVASEVGVLQQAEADHQQWRARSSKRK